MEHRTLMRPRGCANYKYRWSIVVGELWRGSMLNRAYVERTKQYKTLRRTRKIHLAAGTVLRHRRRRWHPAASESHPRLGQLPLSCCKATSQTLYSTTTSYHHRVRQHQFNRGETSCRLEYEGRAVMGMPQTLHGAKAAPHQGQ